MKMRIKTSQSEISLMIVLAIAFFALSAVVLMISGGLQIFYNYQTQREIIFSQQQLIAQEAATEVGSFIQERFGVLETAVNLVKVTEASQTEQERILGNMLGFQPAFRQLVLFDSQGQELAHSSRLVQTKTEAFIGRVGEELFDQAEQTNRYISPVIVDEETSEPLVVIAVPAFSVLGDFQGTLVAELNLRFMWDLVDQLKIGETGYAYVVDKQGNLLAFNDTARVLKGENVSQLPEVSEFIAGTDMGVGDVDGAAVAPGIIGVDSVQTFIPLGTPDWAVVTELPTSEAFQPVTRSVVISSVVILGMAILSGVGGFFVARRLARPLLDLTNTAVQIAEGDINLEASVQGPLEVMRLADAFNSMTGQLRGMIGFLEQRVAARTRALEISGEVSRQISTILDRQELVRAVVEQVKQAFDYYHAHIYLFNVVEQKLEMAGGTGEAGLAMLTRGHSLRLDQGLVGRAATTKEPVLIPDVTQDPTWLPNPLLPDTKAETAVPIVYGDELLGVLDVQHHVTGGLSVEDVRLLQSVAVQVAITLRNARLFEQVQRQAQHEAVLNQINQQILAAPDIEHILQVAAQELGRTLKAKNTTIQLSVRQDSVENGRYTGEKI